MKKQILKIVVILGLLYTSNVLAMTQEEYQEMVSSYKLVDTDSIDKYTTLNSTHIMTYEEYKNLLNSNNIKENTIIADRFIKYFKINGENIQLGISPAINRDEIVTDVNFPKGNFSSSNDSFNADIYDQKLYSVACISKDKEIVISSILQSSSKDKKILFREVCSLKAKYYKGLGYVGNGLFINLVTENTSLSIDEPYEENKTFPYFNEKMILAKLYEAGQCDKEETRKANIEVFLVNGKWVPQEKSWDIIKAENTMAVFNENSSKVTNVGID